MELRLNLPFSSLVQTCVLRSHLAAAGSHRGLPRVHASSSHRLPARPTCLNKWKSTVHSFRVRSYIHQMTTSILPTFFGKPGPHFTTFRPIFKHAIPKAQDTALPPDRFYRARYQDELKTLTERKPLITLQAQLC